MKNYLFILFLTIATLTVNAQDSKKPATAKPAPATKPAAAKPAPAAKPTSVKDTPATKPTSTEQAKPVNDEDLQQAWQEYMTPGANHELLARYSGEWKQIITFWSAPGAQPTTSEVSCIIQMIFDGRYQESIHRGMVNDLPFEGRGLMAYDNAAGKFYSTWIDNMSTGVMQTAGTFDSKNQRMELKGEMVDPVTKKISKIREVVYFRSDNEQLHEMYTTPFGGVEYKSMEIRMMR